MTAYERWTHRRLEDEELTRELQSIQGKDDEIFDRFYKDLEFGTGGLRGVLGAGTNRMNIYTVRRATQGIADVILSKNRSAAPSAAIGYDTRKNAALFAREVACVFAANGITAYLATACMPTPTLSYMVRALGCAGGVMITASHNPAKYNGYKAYGPDGCQMNLEDSERAMERIAQVDVFDGPRRMDYDEAVEKGLIRPIGQALCDQYVDRVLCERLRPEVAADSDLRVVYTPLNGAGNLYVRAALQKAGYRAVEVVPEQEKPDPDFTTCPYPNPEIRAALQLAIEQALASDAQLVFATDPDSDRLGVAVRDGAQFHLLTGNEIGALLLDYIASSRIALGRMPARPLAVKTIVTTRLADAIARQYGVELEQVLTGFKFIGEKITQLERRGEADRFIFGFEESYSFLVGTHVRDKDAVVTSLLFCEMAAYYAARGRSVLSVLDGLYARHGIFLNTQQNFEFEGAAGMQKMRDLLDLLRREKPAALAGVAVQTFSDYEQSSVLELATGASRPIDLPRSNVVGLLLVDGCEVIVRPSGTEPKIKLYFTATAPTRDEAKRRLEALMQDTDRILGL